MSNEISAVSYKKGNWMRYTLWALAAICIAILIFTFINMMSGEISASVPEDYKFAISDEYGEGAGKVRTTYYVYDEAIYVETEGYNDDGVDRVVLIYDGVNTSKLEYNEADTTKVCYEGNCVNKPKVLVTIKNLIANKIGREYIGI